MTGEHPRYVAYMLRLWQVGSEDGPAWRTSLENPHTGELQVFTDLRQLIAFLEQTTEAPTDTSASQVSGPHQPPA